MNVGAWISNTFGVYWANATATRDFRIQLRGSRSVVLFALYLAVLILVGMFIYWQTAGDSAMSVVDAQSKLQGFYQVIIILLGSMICLVAPALTATAVVMERQRKSLDLVFSAPVSAKYFLVGKMISSYRYTWMLLVLSLPVTAACVVLGGASWSDVLVAYVLLSLQALLLTSIGLLMSTVAQKPVSAIIYSYSLTAIFLFCTAPFAAATAFTGGGTRETNFMAAMSPFFVAQSADTYTIIGSTEVPNWILAGLVVLLVCKLAVLTAGSILAPYGGKELPSLRIHALLYTAALATYLGYGAFSSSVYGMMRSGAPTSDQSVVAGVMVFWLMSPLFIFIPMLACFGLDSERRYWPNGAFRLKGAFDGTPAGALPYIWMLVLLSAGGVWLGGVLQGTFHPTSSFFVYVLFTLGFWTLFWSMARFTSSFLFGLRSARTLQFTSFIVLVILPVPFFSAIASSSGYYDSGSQGIWDYYILRPLFTQTAEWTTQALVYGVGMLVIATTIGLISESRVAKRLAARRNTNERSFAAA